MEIGNLSKPQIGKVSHVEEKIEVKKKELNPLIEHQEESKEKPSFYDNEYWKTDVKELPFEIL